MTAPNTAGWPVATGLALLVAASIIGVPGSALGQAAPPVGHFKCYPAAGESVDPEIARVLLEDQFDVALGIVEQVQILAPGRFCNPVAKTFQGTTSDIVNPNNHLTFYQFEEASGKTISGRVRAVNQFGSRGLAIESAKILAVPTFKQEPGLEPPSGLSHFKCYFAFSRPINGVVGLKDQFEALRHKVLDPLLFCNPVRKFDVTGQVLADIVNPDEHLVCYVISRGNFRNRSLVIENQFTRPTADIVVGPADLLCVPTRKVDFTVS